MKAINLVIFAILTIATCCFYLPGNAQGIPQNYTNVSVDDLTDPQIKQIISQGQYAGLTDSEIIKSAENKGLSSSQAEKLQARINSIRNAGANNTVTDNNVRETQRSVTYQADTVVRPRQKDSSSPIFGADLFRTSNTSFEPNIKLATPVNYILGPDDQLDISVYGNSVVNWKITVSAEGNINLPSGGVLNVAGKSLEQATALIKNRLISKNYAIGNGTNLKVTLGNIRSIKVIMVGELVRPGTYTLPSLATAFNALYLAGGPSDNGSFRSIEIIRNNRVIRHLDIYNFLVKGNQQDNISLQDQDIIRVPTYNTTVEIKGEVKSKGVFEVLPGENLQDVIRFAGGYTNQAYRANIKVSQISDKQRRISDVTESNYKNYIPLAGDIYTVDKILDRYENRVSISGAVTRPGDYELQKNMSLLQLIDKAAGLKEDAFMQRGTIMRLNSDNTSQLLSFNVTDVINKIVNISLQREDQVTIQSIFDLRDRYTVKIQGEVRKPGEFAYADSMNVVNLVLMAGGFSEGASTLRIEVARRIYNADTKSSTSVIAKVFTLDVGDQLKPKHTDFTLKPYDIVSVYSLPGFEKQGTVYISGEAQYPGPYVIERKNEKISDIISRAGGLTVSADVSGSMLKRSYTALLGVNKNHGDSVVAAKEKASRLGQIKSSFNDDSLNSGSQIRNQLIGIDLTEILKKPGSETDLIVKDGDIITIPQQQQVVQVSGEVHVPSGVVFTPNRGLKDYVMNAGGYSSEALKKGSYVIYPNGTVKGTRKFLFFNNYPAIRPGSEIFIPKKPLKRGFNFAEVAGIISALGTTVVLAIISLRH